MCGVIGAIGKGPVVGEILDGLLFIQHRGQDAAGVATFDERTGGGAFRIKRGMGLVREAFAGEDLTRHTGHMGIGQVRYPTIGGGGIDDAQPFEVNSPFGIVMAHNGNLTNFKSLRAELRDEVPAARPQLVRRRGHPERLRRRVLPAASGPRARRRGRRLRRRPRARSSAAGARNSVVSIVAGHGLLAFRDPWGVKPLIYGRKKDNGGWRYMFASESCALTSLGYEVVRDVRPGEVMLVRPGQEPESRQVAEPRHHLCIFEFIYFARPDSEIDGISVYKARLRLGEALAHRFRQTETDIDSVVPVPDSSRPAAQQMAFRLGKPFREGLLKNRYIGAHVHHAGQREPAAGHPASSSRRCASSSPANACCWSTTRSCAATRRSRSSPWCATRERPRCTLASSCPPLRHPCVYGVDMSTRQRVRRRRPRRRADPRAHRLGLAPLPAARRHGPGLLAAGRTGAAHVLHGVHGRQLPDGRRDRRGDRGDRGRAHRGRVGRPRLANLAGGVSTCLCRSSGPARQVQHRHSLSDGTQRSSPARRARNAFEVVGMGPGTPNVELR